MKVTKPIDLKHNIFASLDCDCGADRTGPTAEAHAPSCAGSRISSIILGIEKNNGQEINLDEEPVILFRARDRLTAPMLMYYRGLCRRDGATNFQLDQMDELIQRFNRFALTHADKMKQPGSTMGK